MRRTRWQTLLVVTLVVGVLAAMLTTWLDRSGPGMPTVPWLVVAVEVLIAAVVFSMGWAVRQYLRGRRPTLDPIRAARTAVLAKAACYTGALLAGWYGGQMVAHLAAALPGAGGRAGSAAVAAAGAVVLAGVGLLVEWFCRIPPPSDDDKETERATPDPAAT